MALTVRNESYINNWHDYMMQLFKNALIFDLCTMVGFWKWNPGNAKICVKLFRFYSLQKTFSFFLAKIYYLGFLIFTELILGIGLNPNKWNPFILWNHPNKNPIRNIRIRKIGSYLFSNHPNFLSITHMASIIKQWFSK